MNKDYAERIKVAIDIKTSNESVKQLNRFLRKSLNQLARDRTVDLGLGQWIRGFTSKTTIAAGMLTERSDYLADQRCYYDGMNLQRFLIEMDRWVGRSTMVPGKLHDQAFGSIEHRKEFVSRYNRACEKAAFNKEAMDQRTRRINKETGHLEWIGPTLCVHYGHVLLLEASGKPKADVGGFFVATEWNYSQHSDQWHIPAKHLRSETTDVWPDPEFFNKIQKLSLV